MPRHFNPEKMRARGYELPDTLECLSLWHTRLSAADAALLRAGTGLSLDDSMRSSKGTFMLVP